MTGEQAMAISAQPGAAAGSGYSQRRAGLVEALLETVEVGIVCCDADGVLVLTNRVEREIFGLPARLVGTLTRDLDASIDVFGADGRRLPPEDYPLARALRGEDVSHLEVVAGPIGGPYRDLVVRGRQIIDASGQVLGAVAALTDVSAERERDRALHRAEQEAQRAQAFFQAVLAATPDDIVVTDVVTGAVIYGSSATDVLGAGPLDQEALITRTHPEDRIGQQALLAGAAALPDGEVVALEYRAQHADDRWRWLSRRVTPFRRDETGRVLEVLSIVRDVTDVVEADRRLQHAARHDDLTGLPNRRRLVERLEESLRRGTELGRQVAVLFCDLDGFKLVNDTGGHAAGDAVLIETSRRLLEAVRADDVVARVGGDEFVVVVEPWNAGTSAGQPPRRDAGPRQDRQLAIRIAERLAAAFAQPLTVDGVDYVVTASIGVTYGPVDDAGTTPESLLRAADTAMYRAKALGKNRFEVCTSGD